MRAPTVRPNTDGGFRHESRGLARDVPHLGLGPIPGVAGARAGAREELLVRERVPANARAGTCRGAGNFRGGGPPAAAGDTVGGGDHGAFPLLSP